MTEEGPSRVDSDGAVAPAEYRLVAIWAVVLLVMYGISGYLGVRQLQRHKAETERRRQAWMATPSAEPREQGPGALVPPGPRPVAVRVGVSINRVSEFSLQESAWTAHFDIWFRWSGDAASPGESFRIANGHILQREKAEAFVRGEERYERYRVSARITKSFDPSRFPFGDEGLAVEVEDGALRERAVSYVADVEGSCIGPDAVPQGLRLSRTLAVVHSQGSAANEGGGSPDDAGSRPRSRFIFAMLVVPPGFSMYAKMFQALFASVAIAFVAFVIKPIHVDPRFGLGVGAFFAAVGNNVYVGTLLPPAGHVTLAAMVNAAGLATVFLTLVQSAVSLHLFDTRGKVRLSRFFDRVSLAVFLLGYVGVNLALPLAALP